jgi:hypothetical protein
MLGISLPNQSITEDKSREITTGRNLTLSDLVTQLKHYNSGVKKGKFHEMEWFTADLYTFCVLVCLDALSGLQELFSRHPGMLVSSLSTVVNGIVKLFIDDVS